MSKNNIIYLDLKNLTLQHTDIESMDGKVKKYRTLKKLLVEAEKLQWEYEPEYGIHIIQIFSNK